MPTPSKAFPTRPLGSTGVDVSILGLGGYHLGSVGSRREAVRIVQAALDAGLTFMDNAWEYHDGESEEIRGRALSAGRRERAFLMTSSAATAAARPRPCASSTSHCAG